MINYIDKGYWLHEEIWSQGYRFENAPNPVPDVNYAVEHEAAIQSIIDSFDPLPFAQAEAKEKIKAASATKRLEFVTDAAGKDAEYKTKEAEAVLFEADATVGLYMQARMDATSETAQQVADIWNTKSLAWRTVGAEISAIEDKAVIGLDAETVWSNCAGIASTAITGINNVSG